MNKETPKSNESKRAKAEPKEVPLQEYLDRVKEVQQVVAPKEDNQATKDLIAVIAKVAQGYLLSNDEGRAEIVRRVELKLARAKESTNADIEKARAFFNSLKGQ